VNNVLERIWKERAVTSFEVLSQNLLGKAEKKIFKN
jgi:hypothetical protein